MSNKILVGNRITSKVYLDIAYVRKYITLNIVNSNNILSNIPEKRFRNNFVNNGNNLKKTLIGLVNKYKFEIDQIINKSGKNFGMHIKTITDTPIFEDITQISKGKKFFKKKKRRPALSET